MITNNEEAAILKKIYNNQNKIDMNKILFVNQKGKYNSFNYIQRRYIGSVGIVGMPNVGLVALNVILFYIPQ